MGATGPLLHLDEVSKRYSSGRGDHLALDRLSFSVDEGNLVSLVGPSGCGKSTLLRMILGVTAGDGDIWLHGNRVLGPQAQVGMVFQSPVLLPWRSVLDNVLLPIEVLGKRKRDYLEPARELLNLAGLKRSGDRYPGELSGGMQQRAAICRALIHGPQLLLMDEPFGALDAMTRETMQTELLRIWEETGATILFVTHSIDEAVLMSDRVILMTPGPGRIESDTTIELERPRRGTLRATPEFQQYGQSLREGLGITDI